MSIENKPQKITLTKESKLYFLIILIQKITHFFEGGGARSHFLSEKWGSPPPPRAFPRAPKAPQQGPKPHFRKLF